MWMHADGFEHRTLEAARITSRHHLSYVVNRGACAVAFSTGRVVSITRPEYRIVRPIASRTCETYTDYGVFCGAMGKRGVRLLGKLPEYFPANAHSRLVGLDGFIYSDSACLVRKRSHAHVVSWLLNNYSDAIVAKLFFHIVSPEFTRHPFRIPSVIDLVNYCEENPSFRFSFTTRPFQYYASSEEDASMIELKYA